MKKITVSILLFLLLSFLSNAQNSDAIIGKWKDIDNAEKTVEVYKATDGKYYGKGTGNGFMVFKALVWDKQTNTYKGILINPDNDDEFSITIRLTTTDRFAFKVSKFIMSKKFEFVRMK
jgi:uncharacterized protein (DUF2147 family)